MGDFSINSKNTSLKLSKDDYIVKNLIAKESITIIASSPKMGKTALGLNLAICINQGYSFLDNKVNKNKVFYYCNELSEQVIRKRVEAINLKCDDTLIFHDNKNYIDFDKFEEMVEEKVKLGYLVFFIDTFSKIEYERNFDINSYKDTYKLMSKYYRLIEKYKISFIIMHHTKKGNGILSISEKVIGSTALSGTVDTIIAINKNSELDSEFSLDVTSRIFMSNTLDVKINKNNQLERNVEEVIEELEPSISQLVLSMPQIKKIRGSIVDIASKIRLELASPQQFGKILKRNIEVLKKHGIYIKQWKEIRGQRYEIEYLSEKVEI